MDFKKNYQILINSVSDAIIILHKKSIKDQITI